MVAGASLQNQVKGIVLLNTAGQFGDGSTKTPESEESVLQKFVLKPMKEIIQRVVLGFLFWQAKQPARIESVLKSVCQPLHHKIYIFPEACFLCLVILVCMQFTDIAVLIICLNT